MVDTDVIVVGAGIVGLATARAIQVARPDLSVVVLEKEPLPGLHQTGRNSGVVHSGIYYLPGSSKATLVARGRRMLRDRCADWGIPYVECGKVVVASDDAELPALDALGRRAVANGIEIARLGSGDLRRVEPHVVGSAAIWVPSAAITDFAAVTRSLAAEVVDGGGEVRTSSAVAAIDSGPGEVRVSVDAPDRSTEVRARWLVNCAGLHSDRIARMAGATVSVTITPFRGDYATLSGPRRSRVRGLVYPVPDPRWPFLGVHFTPMVDHTVHVGPSAVLALGREAYDGGVNGTDALTMLGDRGLWRLARRYWRTGAGEMVRSWSPRLVLRAARRLVPDLEPGDLLPAEPGIRAQALDRSGHLVDDFVFARSGRCVHVLNAPSPAATASLAIGAEVADRVLARIDERD